MVCGKRSFFTNVESAETSLVSDSDPAQKKLRRSSSTSPVNFNYSLPVEQSLFDQLKALYPTAESQLLEKALGDSGNNLDSSIKSVHHELSLRHAKFMSVSTVEEDASTREEDSVAQNNLPMHGAEWVDSIINEMKSNTEADARHRIQIILENLEKTISSRAANEATQTSHQENVILKEQRELLLRDNTILKRAVAIQHDRQKDYDDKNQELHQMKQLVAQYQDQIRSLELNNYALRMHLRHVEQSLDAIPLEVPIVQNNLPADGTEWVDSLVSEMMKATSIPDAKSRAVVILESLEKTISTRAAAEATQTSHKEILMLKEQMELLVRDNNILKRAVAIQHDRQKDIDLKNQEFQQLAAQYQEQMRTLELNNYALRMHLQQAEHSSPIPGRFHPDVF